MLDECRLEMRNGVRTFCLFGGDVMFNKRVGVFYHNIKHDA